MVRFEKENEKQISFFFERIKRFSKQNGNEQNEASKYARYMVKSRNARTVGEEATRIGKGTRKEEEQESRRRRRSAKKERIGRIEGGKGNDILVYIAILACDIVENLFYPMENRSVTNAFNPFSFDD